MENLAQLPFGYYSCLEQKKCLSLTQVINNPKKACHEKQEIRPINENAYAVLEASYIHLHKQNCQAQQESAAIRAQYSQVYFQLQKVTVLLGKSQEQCKALSEQLKKTERVIQAHKDEELKRQKILSTLQSQVEQLGIRVDAYSRSTQAILIENARLREENDRLSKARSEKNKGYVKRRPNYIPLKPKLVITT